MLYEVITLIGGPGHGIHAGMVGKGFYPVHLQGFSQFLHFFPGKAINNSGFTGISQDEFDNPLGGVDFRSDFVIEIMSPEGGFKHACLQHIQVLLNIMLHLWSGCGRITSYNVCYTKLLRCHFSSSKVRHFIKQSQSL